MQHKSVIDAAAFQDALSRKLNLKNVTKKPNSQAAEAKRASNQIPLSEARRVNNQSLEFKRSSNHVCTSCNASVQPQEQVCGSCGYFLHQNRPRPTSPETLAHRRGLIQHKAVAVHETVSAMEWKAIEDGLKTRAVDAYCPICMEAFKEGHEVLLSCSHIFHRQCLSAFEKFMNKSERLCPICRHNNYQKKITHAGSNSYQLVCILKIQTFYRGYVARKSYRSSLRTYYRQGRGDNQQKSKFYKEELSIYTNKISKEVDNRGKEVETMCDVLDNTLRESRELDQLFDSLLQQRLLLSSTTASRNISSYESPEKDEDYLYLADSKHSPYERPNTLSDAEWNEILQRSRERGLGECAICMCGLSHYDGDIKGGTPSLTHLLIYSFTHSLTHSLGMTKRSKFNVLLSCSHIFHEKCINNFERFSVSAAEDATHHVLCCPICRMSNYMKYKFKA